MRVTSYGVDECGPAPPLNTGWAAQKTVCMISPQPGNRSSPTSAKGSILALPKGIWVLGPGSMFMDISSELVHSLLPIFMATVLGASMVMIGLIEGRV